MTSALTVIKEKENTEDSKDKEGKKDESVQAMDL